MVTILATLRTQLVHTNSHFKQNDSFQFFRLRTDRTKLGNSWDKYRQFSKEIVR
jgi:hypothetical protein